MSRAHFLSEPDRVLIDQADGAAFCGYDDGQGWTTWFGEDGRFICVTETPGNGWCKVREKAVEEIFQCSEEGR